ncbi:replication-relaxation family protein [Nocardia sp. NPDC004068]|uniref:replication-relaxation family protein n=1 Tax=Nocardia sp. NPDC004068 TaxID=3364303 RepID=UPI003677F914
MVTPKPRVASPATPTSYSPASAVAAQRQLTARDMTLLSLLADHHVLTTTHIANLLYPSENVARKRLAKLTARGVLARFRHCPGPGSVSWRYTLGPLGAMITAADNAHPTLPTAAKTHEKMLRISRSQKLEHLLGVNDFFSQLAAYAKKNHGCALREWWNERTATESNARIVHPDGYGEWEEKGRRIEFFLEFDNGTERLADVAAKLDGYRELAHAGRNIPILFVFTGTHRRDNFHTRLTAHPDTTAGLTVATATTTDITDHGAAGKIWWPLDGRLAYRRLIDLPAPPAVPLAA